MSRYKQEYLNSIPGHVANFLITWPVWEVYKKPTGNSNLMILRVIGVVADTTATEWINPIVSTYDPDTNQWNTQRYPISFLWNAYCAPDVKRIMMASDAWRKDFPQPAWIDTLDTRDVLRFIPRPGDILYIKDISRRDPGVDSSIGCIDCTDCNDCDNCQIMRVDGHPDPPRNSPTSR
jgi:hypothetical protein